MRRSRSFSANRFGFLNVDVQGWDSPVSVPLPAVSSAEGGSWPGSATLRRRRRPEAYTA